MTLGSALRTTGALALIQAALPVNLALTGVALLRSAAAPAPSRGAGPERS